MTIYKKAKKSFCPRANTGSTHHGMRCVDSKLFSSVKIQNLFLGMLTPFVGLI